MLDLHSNDRQQQSKALQKIVVLTKMYRRHPMHSNVRRIEMDMHYSSGMSALLD